jgi:hypothetical protein
MKGLTVSIYKDNGKSYDGKGNFSSRLDRVVVLPSEDFPNIPEIFEGDADGTNYVKIIKRAPTGKEIFTAYPCDAEGNIDKKTWYMFGGCYLMTSDSRFPFQYPVPLHDRTE